MSVYFFVYFIILLFTILSYKKNMSFGIFYVMFIVLFLLSSFRYDIGRDYSTYRIIFETPEKINSTNEQGFMIINNLLKTCGFSFQSLIIIWSGLTLLFALLFIKENSSEPVFSVFIFYTFSPFFLNSLNTIRQSLCIYIFLYSTKYIRQRKFFKYFLILFIASFISHKSAIVLIPLYFILNKNLNGFIKLLMIFISFFSSTFLEVILSNIPSYSIYLKMNFGAGVSPVLLADFFICTISVILLRKEEDKLFYNISFICLCFLIVLITISGSPVFTPISRINEYFLPAIIILVPEIIKKLKKTNILLFCSAILFFSGIFVLGIVIKGIENENVPYKIFFAKFDIPWIYDTIFIIALCFIFYICAKKRINRYIT